MRVRLGLVAWAIAASLGSFCFGGCGSPPAPAVVPMASASPADIARADGGAATPAADGSDAGEKAEKAHDAGPAETPIGPRTCGCSLCAPVASDDTCTTDADCAPSQPCHAPACVARSKAQLRKPGEMCTRIMMCATADANACGCVSGRCTLSPRKP